MMIKLSSHFCAKTHGFSGLKLTCFFLLNTPNRWWAPKIQSTLGIRVGSFPAQHPWEIPSKTLGLILLNHFLSLPLNWNDISPNFPLERRFFSGFLILLILRGLLRGHFSSKSCKTSRESSIISQTSWCSIAKSSNSLVLPSHWYNIPLFHSKRMKNSPFQPFFST